MNLQLNLSQLHGWIILDKGMGCSSARAVSQIKKLFGASKVGHAGTLDPLATGVLPVALGEATKTVNFIIMGKESYKILSTSTKYSMILFGSIVLFFLLASSINFSWIFTQFHLLSFSNDLWILDPRKDKLIMMFPQRFFLETTLLIGLFTIVEYLIIWFGFELNYRKKN